MVYLRDVMQLFVIAKFQFMTYFHRTW